MWHRLALAASALAAVILAPSIARAQSSGACRVFCTPELLVEPTWTIENLARRPRLADAAGHERRIARDPVFELVLAVDVPTRLQRIGFTTEAAWTPSSDDNQVELELELNLHLLLPEQTGGWVSSHFDVVDQFGPAERPDASAAYTHKLDFELDTAFPVFRRAPSPFLRSIEIEASLDYVATGLPRRADVIDGSRYLDPASPWSFSAVLVIPIAPL